MVDLYLQAMLHGEFSKQRKSNVSSAPKDKFDLAAEKYINEYINSLNLEVEYAQNLLVTPAIKRAQLKQEMIAEMKTSEANNYLSEAFRFINAEGVKYFGEELYQEFERIDHAIEKMDPSEELPENLQVFFNFNEKMAAEILKVAILKFQEEDYQTSLSLFVLLSILMPENEEYWYRQGIAAQKCEEYDLALKAYGEALNLNPDLIGIKLFSVECYLEKDLIEEAKTQLAEAKQLAAKSDVDEMWISFIKELEAITGWNVEA